MSEINTHSSAGEYDPEQIFYEAGRIVMHEQENVIAEYAESGFDELIGFLETKVAAPVPAVVTEQKKVGEDIAGYVLVIGAGFVLNSLFSRWKGK